MGIANNLAELYHALNEKSIWSGGRFESHSFQIELMKIKTAGNDTEFENE